MQRIIRLSRLFLSIVFLFALIIYKSNGFYQRDSYEFDGNGTESSPYLIDSCESLMRLRDLVNDGNSFKNKYFLQTTDIDLIGNEWIPIGIFSSAHFFSGIYDGGCHSISNIYISDNYPYSPANVGLFGMLDGMVKNLGIESGEIKGEYAGSVCSHGTANAVIMNCYNKATVIASGRAGGICDNLSNGGVINCINLGYLEGPVTGIISYSSGYAFALWPDYLPDTFNGSQLKICSDIQNEKELLNYGINQLEKLKIINKKDVISWR